MDAHRVVDRIDLNLLVPLDALLEERSVTRAAERIGRSQPACSAALGRLRRHFGDPLLVRAPGEGRGYALTPLAESLRPLVAELLDETERLLSSSPTVDPATLERDVFLVAADVDVLAYVPHLARRLRATAPGVRLRIDAPVRPLDDPTNEGLRAVDGAIRPHRLLAGLPSLDLFEERWVCVADGASTLPGQPTLAELSARPWVAAFDGPTRRSSPAGQALAAAGLPQRVELRTESFVGLLALVAGTDRVALVPGRLARTLGAATGTRALRPPPELAAPYTIAFAWHPARERDPVHRWLRGEVVAAARDMAAPATAAPATA